MVAFAEFALLISRVLGDHAIFTERHPLDKQIEPLAFVVAASK